MKWCSWNLQFCWTIINKRLVSNYKLVMLYQTNLHKKIYFCLGFDLFYEVVLLQPCRCLGIIPSKYVSHNEREQFYERYLGLSPPSPPISDQLSDQKIAKSGWSCRLSCRTFLVYYLSMQPINCLSFSFSYIVCSFCSYMYFHVDMYICLYYVLY